MVLNINTQNYEDEKAALLSWMQFRKFKPETIQKFRSFFARAESSTNEYVFTWVGKERSNNVVNLQASFIIVKGDVKKYQLFSGFCFDNNNKITNRFTQGEICDSRVTIAEIIDRVGNDEWNNQDVSYFGTFR